jgi:replicative DNA helicase
VVNPAPYSNGKAKNGSKGSASQNGGGAGGPFSREGMPQSLEAERVALGSMLIDNSVIALAVEALSTDGAPLYSAAHREIYQAILALTDEAAPVDPATVAHELERRGALERVGGPPYLARLEMSVLTPENIGAHLKVVVDKWQLRRLIEACCEIAEKAREDSEPVPSLLEGAERAIFSIASTRRSRRTPKIDELAKEALEEIDRRSKDRRDVTGVATGYADLDAKTGGLQKTDLVILAARPSMGKTAFALNICQNVAGLGSGFRRDQARPAVAIFSLEMSARQLTQRVLASIARVNLHRLRTGRIDPRMMELLEDKAAELAGSSLLIEDTPGLTILELRSRARRLASMRPDLGLVMIDYLQLMTGGGRRSENRQQEVSDISRSLKELARELDVPILALSQLSRQSEQRSGRDKRPLLSDLRESGSIEQDADVVMFVHREDYYRRKEKEDENGGGFKRPGSGGGGGGGGGGGDNGGQQAFAPEIAEIIIGKQRNGPTGVVELLFLPDLASFMPMSKQRHPDEVPNGRSPM